jgi:hypothetical protein
MVTSRAVVGSSAMSRLGAQAIPNTDHGALAHAAAELVRIILSASLGRWDAHTGQKMDGLLPQGAPRPWEVQGHGFKQLLPHPEDGVQGGNWVLKDHGDLFSPDVC